MVVSIQITSWALLTGGASKGAPSIQTCWPDLNNFPTKSQQTCRGFMLQQQRKQILQLIQRCFSWWISFSHLSSCVMFANNCSVQTTKNSSTWRNSKKICIRCTHGVHTCNVYIYINCLICIMWMKKSSIYTAHIIVIILLHKTISTIMYIYVSQYVN